MSVCSEVDIAYEEAKERVERILMRQQRLLVTIAINKMSVQDLSYYLNNQTGSSYYYCVEAPIGEVEALEEETKEE